MTDRCLSQIRLTTQLSGGKPFFVVRPSVSLEDSSICDLLMRLEADGWSARECAKPRPHPKGKKAVPVLPPAPFTQGSEKIFWATPDQKTWFRGYLLALLQSAQHQQPVIHLMLAGWYDALLLGEEYRPRP
jgi:hypothetical protein